MGNDTTHGSIYRNGLWSQNVALVQLLGLCPMLAVTTSVVNGLGLGLASTFVLLMSNGMISALRRILKPEIRIAAYVLIIAALVTTVELIFKAWLPLLDRSLGIFLPLIVTNCAIVARAEAFASRNPVFPSISDGLATGLGFALVLMLMGGIREVLGHGTLFSNLDYFGLEATGLRFADSGMLVALLPPGAFFALAFLIALHRFIVARREPAGELQTEP